MQFILVYEFIGPAALRALRPNPQPAGSKTFLQCKSMCKPALYFKGQGYMKVSLGQLETVDLGTRIM